MTQYKIIVNPTSGRGNGERIIPFLEEQFKTNQIEYDLTRTERPLHAIELARQAVVDGYEIVVAVGGDGTANEVINGLMLAKEDGIGDRVAMGVLGAGRGNDFAYGVGMPVDLAAGCEVLSKRQHRIIDIGFVTGGQFPDGRFFGNSVGIGFDAVVGFEAVKMTRLSGIPSYLVAVLKTVFLYFKPPKVQIEYDEQITTMKPLMISIMNGQRQGGTFFMSPEAKNDDGLLDLCIVNEVSKARVFTLVPHFFKGSQFGQKEVSFGQTSRVMIKAVEGVLPAHCDGETLCTDGTKLEVELLPGRLDVICPLN